jgi:thiosulfate/3-mercaptopyruvate sulfurtransferase
MSNNTQSDVLVSTEWVLANLKNQTVRLVEVDLENTAYGQGHIPGAIAWSWQSQLSDPVRRDIIPSKQFEQLLSEAGIRKDTTVVLYGDNNNWFAAWAFWQLKIYGHPDVRLLNGGRKKWIQDGRELRLEAPVFPHTNYKAQAPDYSIRAFLPDAQAAARKGSANLVDVRSPQEGIDGRKPIITYCRIGERSSHTWFVLKYLPGYDNVVNYDGSWTEWGNLVGASVERGLAKPVKESVAHAG